MLQKIKDWFKTRRIYNNFYMQKIEPNSVYVLRTRETHTLNQGQMTEAAEFLESQLKHINTKIIIINA